MIRAKVLANEVAVALLWIVTLFIAGFVGYIYHGTDTDVIVDTGEIACDWDEELYDGEQCLSRSDHKSHTGD
jgi:hypothetical protein